MGLYSLEKRRTTQLPLHYKNHYYIIIIIFDWLEQQAKPRRTKKKANQERDEDFAAAISPLLQTWATTSGSSFFLNLLSDSSSSFHLLLVSCSDFLFKLLLIGDSSVGKSCLLLRFAVCVFLYPSCPFGVFLCVYLVYVFISGWFLCW